MRTAFKSFWAKHPIAIPSWTVGTLAVIGLLLWQQNVLNGILLGLRTSTAWLVLIVVLVLAGVVIMFGYDTRNGYVNPEHVPSHLDRNDDPEEQAKLAEDAAKRLEQLSDNRIGKRAFVVGIVVAALALVAFILACMFSGYLASKDVLSSVNTTSGDITAYQTRAPFAVAEAQTKGQMTTNGNLEDTSYVAADGYYGTAIEGRGFNDGYTEVVWQQVGDSGQSVSHNCLFTVKTPRFHGYFDANLERAILRQTGDGIFIDQSDTYGACINGKAVVIVPLKQLAGFPFTHEVPAGVAVADGTTGQVTIYKTVKAGDLPGPVYPLSLSKQARSATKASGSWLDDVQGRVGFEATGDNDEGNTNNAEFTLRRADNTGDDYVTPLTLQGNSQSISAVGVVASNEVSSGHLNTYTAIKMATPRQQNSGVVSRLKADYGSLPEWAAGMTIFEIVPIGPGEWSATLGFSQTVKYRAVVNPDSSSCLYSTSGVKIRCSADTTKAVAGVDVTSLSDADLAALLQAASVEAAKRLTR